MKQAQNPEAMNIEEIWTSHQQIIQQKYRESHAALIKSLCEDEVTSLCGKRYSPKIPGQPYRAGSDTIHIPIDGIPVLFKKPRVKQNQKELPLQSIATMHQEHQETARELILRASLSGVSTRGFKNLAKQFALSTGISRASVSRVFQTKAMEAVTTINSRSLREYRITSICIDTGFYGKFTRKSKKNRKKSSESGHALISALGVTDSGEKIFLGLQESHSENSAQVEKLLRNLVDRGLSIDQPRLFILDGSRALHKSVKDMFGDSAKIQRCKLHKQRNLESHMSQQNSTLFSEKREIFRRLWQKIFRPEVNSLELAEKRCDELEQWLAREGFDQAIPSFQEGRKELLCGFELGLSSEARKSFMTTNIFESPASTLKESMRRVKFWRTGKHLLRYSAIYSLKIEKNFNKVDPKVIQSLTESLQLQSDDHPATHSKMLLSA